MGLEFLAIPRHENLPWNTEKGRCMVVGSGRCVWRDMEPYIVHCNQNVELRWDVIAVNDVGMHIPFRVKHWYSNDQRWLGKWAAARRPAFQKYLDDKITLHTCAPGHSGMHEWPFPGHGSSGLNATYLALALGYEEIVVAGVPLDDSGHYFDAPWVKTNFSREVPERPGGPRYWRQAQQKVWDGKVKVLSGRMLD